ncbi:hypothetical protein U1Q18_025937, partial [Sarracenia purpurea var. burkii]
MGCGIRRTRHAIPTKDDNQPPSLSILHCQGGGEQSIELGDYRSLRHVNDLQSYMEHA